MSDQKAYPAWQFTLEATSITVFFGFTAAYLASTFYNYADRSLTSENLWLILIWYAVLAYITADFISGLFHFLADNFGNPDTPIVGKVFIYAFREHHVDPKAITRHGFVETNGANCLISLPGMIYFYYASAPVADFTFRFFFVCFFFSIFLTNQIHKWAHQDAPSKLVQFFQRIHLILPPMHHDVHHHAPYDKYYCITSGWLNAPLNAVHFFQGLKRVLSYGTAAQTK